MPAVCHFFILFLRRSTLCILRAQQAETRNVHVSTWSYVGHCTHILYSDSLTLYIALYCLVKSVIRRFLPPFLDAYSHLYVVLVSDEHIICYCCHQTSHLSYILHYSSILTLYFTTVLYRACIFRFLCSFLAH